MTDLQAAINIMIRKEIEYKERALAHFITNYDFIVGSIECKHRLMTVLPEAATIRCTPYIEDPTTIFVIKKFNIMDLLQETESEQNETLKMGVNHL